MQSRHALNFLTRTQNANLVAVFSPDERELRWARTNLELNGVAIYKDYDEMLRHSGLEAVVVATVTKVHPEQTIKAIEAGMHVLCEKPLSTSVEEVSYTRTGRGVCTLELNWRIAVTKSSRNRTEAP